MLQIKEKKDCCGCEACVQRCPQQCITVREDSEGFLYPVVDEGRCTDCGLCERVCPGLQPGEPREPLKVYAAKNPDEKVRIQSSSGGIFSLLAEQVIRAGGVVFGARFDGRWEVVHDYTEAMEGLEAFRGSKYVQSRTGETYRQAETFLRAGRKVLFCGTPCQIAGLKLFLRKEYENLLTVDFICHGVPSLGVWRKYLQEIAARRAAGKNTVLSASLNTSDDISQNISSISFRDKALGWKKFSFVVRLSATDGAEKNSVLLSECFSKNLFMRGFLTNLYLRPSCYACPAKSFRSGSDMTIGDFWGVECVLPDFDDDKGISGVMLNSRKAEVLWKSIPVDCKSVLYPQLYRANPALEMSAKESGNRKLFVWKEGQLLLPLIERLTRESRWKKLKAGSRFCLRVFLQKTGLFHTVISIIRKCKI